MTTDKATRNNDINNDIIHDKSDNIKIEGHKGTWYVVNSEIINDKLYFQLEHEEYGDEAAHLIVDRTGKIVLDEVWNGFDDLKHFVRLNPKNYLTGEKIPTPRGRLSLTTLSKEEMEASGYGFWYNSNDGKYDIMSNGTRAFAVVVKENLFKNSTEKNCNMIDGTVHNRPAVAELVDDIKRGESISIIDLLDVTRREQKENKSYSRYEEEMER